MEKITWQTSPDGREESAMNKINEIVQWINEYEEKIIANKPPGIKSVLPEERCPKCGKWCKGRSCHDCQKYW